MIDELRYHIGCFQAEGFRASKNYPRTLLEEVNKRVERDIKEIVFGWWQTCIIWSEIGVDIDELNALLSQLPQILQIKGPVAMLRIEHHERIRSG